ncbi:MAG TPA: beta-N-acetylglucosaminidase domain-containing protein [Longimicrobiales bacterium]|nr:beta-N-acetylglucosaminidase domain-containing protein [Longimicrobiales bacterium]
MQLGIIEGYYGKPWEWRERAETMRFLAGHGYRFYMYAPKADVHLRRLWREQHPDDVAQEIAGLAGACRKAGVRFGIGLSPTKLHVDFGAQAQQALARKLDALNQLGIDFLALLFDDMKGDVPDLAKHQIEIVHWVAERHGGELLMCPSYYTDDPVLDRVFGARPAGYLEELGRGIDASVQMFWTGEEVCAREISTGHVERVAEQMRRQPFLWDNYPVNDGERMSQYLNVRAFTGRPAGLADVVAGHGINPALQPTLSRAPAISLARSYELGARYEYGAVLLESAMTAFGAQLGRYIHEDVLLLQDVGLDRLGEKEKYLRERYTGIDHAAAREIIAWLDGAYRITDEIVRAQSAEE